ncbi:YfjP family GTPase [Streptomyces galbus]|uniref:YfjP family GTPase n=1 Tax=Streptomyces galbus TaxID=33898 RepID=UPI0037AE4225
MTAVTDQDHDPAHAHVKEGAERTGPPRPAGEPAAGAAAGATSSRGEGASSSGQDAPSGGQGASSPEDGASSGEGAVARRDAGEDGRAGAPADGEDAAGSADGDGAGDGKGDGKGDGDGQGDDGDGGRAGAGAERGRDGVNGAHTVKEHERHARGESGDASVGVTSGAGSAPAKAADAPERVKAGDGAASAKAGEGHARVNGDGGRPRGRGDARGKNGDDSPRRTDPPAPRADDSARRGDDVGAWDDGLIARRVSETAAAAAEQAGRREARGAGAQSATTLALDGPLRSRLDALRELVGLSRTRLDSKTLAEAGKVLDEAASRRRLSGRHTVVAIAGATGSGKSQLFNALAGVTISETGVRRPTTASPIACSWSDGAGTLIDRLGIPGRLRRRPVQSPEAEAQLQGLVLVDLPDHDSAAVQHREQVDRILTLVDAVIWVVDPEKYADAMLHERYLRPMAGHAEVMFVVLNQVDRLPGEAAELVLDDLRRLLDEDGVALGEYGEPGATVLALSALTGEGIGELREVLGQFVTERRAPARRIAADVDAAASRLRPVYTTGRRAGLSEEARDEFAARLADAVGATAAGEAAERAWLRNANRACGTPWLRLWRWYNDRREPPTGRMRLRPPADEEATARQRVEQAVRTVADRASAGLPVPWAQAVREAAVRGAHGLPEALDELAARAGLPPGKPPRPGWWPVAVLAQASMTILQIVGGLWLVGQIVGFMAPNLGVPVLLMVAGIVGGPVVEWSCRMAARGPARRYGQDAERRLREAAAGCGRARVLDPVAAELLRYREVREQYGKVVGVG